MPLYWKLSAGQGFGLHASSEGSLELQLKPQDSQLIVALHLIASPHPSTTSFLQHLILAPPYSGPTSSWHHLILAPPNPGTISSWHHLNMAQTHPGTISSWHLLILAPPQHGTNTSCHHPTHSGNTSS